MIYQVTNGKRCNVSAVSGSQADLEKIAAVLEGEVEIFTLEYSGGTEKKGIILNTLGFSAGKKSITNSYRSASVVFAHIKPSKTFVDVVLAVKGVWDADYTSTENCTYVNGFRANSKG